jgi:hypothetical protein
MTEVDGDGDKRWYWRMEEVEWYQQSQSTVEDREEESRGNGITLGR